MATEIERRYAQIARSLAQHLTSYAKERRPEDQKAVSALNAELCRVYREEKANGNSN